MAWTWATCVTTRRSPKLGPAKGLGLGSPTSLPHRASVGVAGRAPRAFVLGLLVGLLGCELLDEPRHVDQDIH
jgi:hypothetical protein